MKELNIEPTSTSPKVIFDPTTNIFEITGESRPENASVFYKPIIDWVKELEMFFANNEKQTDTPFEFNFHFDW